ncbi:hypothetical protein AGMMS49545_24180 [Betaproteobacteria bacterium]|nr:hypothetical protein AGMMS49545_24180 [Betaproteobacteria bacterium]
MGEKTWSGSKTIHWTETRNWTEMQQNANGQTVPVHRSETISHSQTLTASISRPCPYYHNNTQLWYANEAAPNLSFSRVASNIDEKGAFSAWRLKRANKKALDKKQKQSLAQGGNFMLTDSEFETLFNAHDRDHEVEFRLLFTPLARKQMLSLMKENTEGYGDDFAFVKTGKMNAIFPRHLQKFEFIEAPLQFSHFNFKAARQRFIDYHHDFFRHLYFAFAPLMTIPIYQQTPPPATAGYGAERVSPWASEVMAHHLGAAHFIPPEAATPVVLKANRDQVGNEIAMTGHAFRTEGRVHTVNMRGNDGDR